jgi:tetratricopeptide (TPR) repeat protein
MMTTRKGSIWAFSLIFLLSLAFCPFPSSAAQKKAKRSSAGKPAAEKALPEKSTSDKSGGEKSEGEKLAVVSVQGITDANVQDQFKAAESLAKKGKTDEALRMFMGVYEYTRDALALMKCVKGSYDKAVAGPGLEQNQREDLYLKLQRISVLSTQYGKLKGETAYQMGAAYAKKGNGDQARKYLIEACQTVPFSLENSSTWMRSKNLLLALANLEGEF